MRGHSYLHARKLLTTVLHTLHLKERFRKNNEREKPFAWGCLGPVWALFFTYWKIKHPAFFEMAVNTHSPFCPDLADFFACVLPALKKGWMFYFPICKK